MSRRPLVDASAIVVLLTLFLTWPQAFHLGTKLANHDDSYFSVWRIAWIAHALKTDPRHLFDANVFYPERLTLAYSDATLLEGVVAAPFLWAGVSPVLLYNLLLLGGIAASGVGMFVLVRYLTRNTGAALVSAAIFTLLPYRIQHYAHLELQWTMWMPLAFWAVHRATAEASWRFGVWAGIFVWLQVLSCVYYGVFLAPMVALLALLLIAARPRQMAAALAGLGAGALVALALTYPYSRPYIENARTLGARTTDDVLRFSATLLSYLASPRENWVWGWTAGQFTGDELSFFPGIVAIGLGLVAFARRRREPLWAYAVLGLVAVELSLGFNGRLYPWIYAHLWLLHGLRAPARFSILAFCALSVLAGFGVDHLQSRCSTGRSRVAVCTAALILLAIECGSAPMKLEDVPTGTPDVYRMVNRLGPGVMVELPTPRPTALAGVDSTYGFWSITHWNPLVNGYSGYVPKGYVETLKRMLTFPDDESMARLKELDVRYVVVHEHLYKPPEFVDLMLRMEGRSDLIPRGRYRDWTGHAALFELRR
jgi:hypothetical protein